MPSVNQKLVDKILIRASTIERLAAGDQQDALAALDTLERDLVAAVERAGLTRYNRERLTRLLNRTRKLTRAAYKKVREGQQESLERLAELELQWTTRAINATLGVEAVTISLAPLVSDITKNILIENATLASWWNGQATDLQKRFAGTLRTGLLQGEPVLDIIDRIRGTKARNFTDGIMAVSRAHAHTLTRTAVQAVSAEARMRTYQEGSDVMKGIMQLSTLDSATSDICMAYSRKSWLLDGTPIGHTLPFSGGTPRHWNCRSTLTPILYSYQELFARSPDIFGDITPAGRAKLSQTMDGQPPEAPTYQEWLRKQSVTKQQEILGPVKYPLWQQGVLRDLSDLVSQTGRPLRTADLLQRLGVPPARSAA